MSIRTSRFFRAAPLAVLLSVAVAGAPLGAIAYDGPSDASSMKGAPIALPLPMSSAVISGAAILTVVAVEAASDGATWMLERASDGAHAGVRLSTQAAGGLSVAAGTVLAVTAISTGWLLSAAGQVIAFVPNAVGSALLHNERVTR